MGEEKAIRKPNHAKDSKTKLYFIWRGILNRCNNQKTPQYKNYWGRWVTCEWKTFEEFKSDMWWSYVEWLSIDRVDNNWNYSRENCRRITMSEQQHNKNTNVTYKGKTLTQRSNQVWIPVWTIWYRIKMGRDFEKSISTPIKIQYRNKSHKENLSHKANCNE